MSHLQHNGRPTPENPLEKFLPHVGKVEELVKGLLVQDLDLGRGEVRIKNVNDSTRRIFASTVDILQRKQSGAYFTGPSLCSYALGSYPASVEDGGKIFDPACGIGDLLLACTPRLPVSHYLADTLDDWGERIYGCDIHPEFVRLTRARLALAALSLGAKRKPGMSIELDRLFPNVVCSNGLSALSDASHVSHIVVNPPYYRLPAPSGCLWARGSVSAAALFVDCCLANAVPGTRITAILPDVLRTGTRYRRWREFVANRSHIERIDVYGDFKAGADVDVFVAHLVVADKDSREGSTSEGWWGDREKSCITRLADFFRVSVGPVVPHRHKEEGRTLPFLHARNAPPWATIEAIKERRSFVGTTFDPPFLAVRRTSSPSDRYRATATLVVTGGGPVAVENHLLVLTPLDGQVGTCELGLRVLKDERTNAWFNERIRCRHLTVGSVQELPWWPAS